MYVTLPGAKVVDSQQAKPKVTRLGSFTVTASKGPNERCQLPHVPFSPQNDARQGPDNMQCREGAVSH